MTASHRRQMLGSLLAAVLIVVLAIVVVTATFGPTSEAGREQREDAQEELLEQREDLEEERLERREDRGRDGGDPGGGG